MKNLQNKLEIKRLIKYHRAEMKELRDEVRNKRK